MVRLKLVILEHEKAHVFWPLGQWVFLHLLSRDPRTSKSPGVLAGALKEHQMARGEKGPLRMGVRFSDQRQLAICCGQISRDGLPTGSPALPAPLRGRIQL